MAYYDECEKCGAKLDPGEKCDCERKDDEDEKRGIEITGPVR